MYHQNTVSMVNDDNFFFSTCLSQSSGSTSSIEVSPDSINYNPSGGSHVVGVTANVAWSVVAMPTWITVAPFSASGSATITVTAAPNSGAYRSGVVTLSGSGASANINVTQEEPI